MKKNRRKTKLIKVGNVGIGGGSPVSIQSMTTTLTKDVKKTVDQIKELERAGCEIIRVGVPDMESAKAIGRIKKEINIPLVADIHFSVDLAIESINQGADKIRINPGNFPKSGLAEIVKLAKKKRIPIRIGVNSGSLEKDILKERAKATPEMMVKSALQSIRLMEKLKFYNLVIAIKASDAPRTIKANQLLAEKVNYPFHLGVTEAGGEFSGTIKSAVAFGALLSEGIGDTLRVSLSADPIKEVKAGWEILKSLELRERGLTIISCPTCARSKIPVIQLSKYVDENFSDLPFKKPFKIAIMGCVVNGPGEAREADLGVVGVENENVAIFEKGKFVKNIKSQEIKSFLRKKIESVAKTS